METQGRWSKRKGGDAEQKEKYWVIKNDYILLCSELNLKEGQAC